MAEDRNNSQGFVGQAHTAGESLGGRAASTASSVDEEDSPPRGPRTLLLRRGENGFGFTLRHFIVYPPESCCMLPGHERTRIEEPMDTIFVKQVRENSPAAEAGLRTGDRVVSVDGKATRGEQYAKVVQRIQQAGPWLRLLVVSKEDDILQRYFGETAHNPETNQRPRVRSPERNGQRQRRSVSMIPGLSPRSRQSWVCAASGSLPQPISIESDRPPDDIVFYRQDQDVRSNEFARESEEQARLNEKLQSQLQSSRSGVSYQQRSSKPFQEAAVGRYESIDEKVRSRNPQQQQTSSTDGGANSMLQDAGSRYKYEGVYDGSPRPESIYSRTNSEQIYDRIKDPIYERVRLGGESGRESTTEEHLQQQYYQVRQQHSSLTPRYPLSRAEPQVPIYRPASRRVTSRRASEGSTASSTINAAAAAHFETGSYASMDALRSCDPGSRFSIDSRRECSPLRNDDPLLTIAGQQPSPPPLPPTSAPPSSYDTVSSAFLSNGTGNEHRTENPTGTRNSDIDDSVIMTRLRKSFEQKEEFLRRPSHPIGWFLPDDRPGGTAVRNTAAAVIPREFYARPQKLQKQIWPPNESKQDQQLSVHSRSFQEKAFLGKCVSEGKSSSNQLAQRAKSDAAMTRQDEYLDPRLDGMSNLAESLEEQQQPPPPVSDRRSSSSVYEDRRRLDARSESNEIDRQQSQQQQQQELHRSAGKSSFVGTLTRIHENVTSAASLLSSERHVQDTRNGGASSLPSSPGPEKKVNDKSLPTLPQGLQIVSKRAKQFESGRLMSDEDEPTGDRTSLYKSELSRLSHKRSVPNVAVRKREFESKAEAQEPRRAIVTVARETKSLDTGNGLKGNRVIPVGSSRIHCEPPADYKPIEETTRSTDGDIVRSRVRSNSAESWESVSGHSQTCKHRWLQETERKERANANHAGYYSDATRSVVDEKSGERGARKQDGYAAGIGTERAAVTENGNNGVVFRRPKNAQIADEDRATRRVSYLKATWGERMHVDSDLDFSDSEAIHTSRSNDACAGQEPIGIARDAEQVEREGPLHVKFTVLDGKRSSDRSWKQVWGVLRGPILFFHKDRQNQSPSLASDSENVAQSVDVRCSLVDIAEDYTKRKHVLRLANPSAEVLLQTEDAASMALWLRALHEHAAAEKPSEIAYNSTSKQQAVPQAPAPSSGGSSATYQVASIAVPSNGGQRLSPLPGHKGIKKLTSFRNRSPTGQSPINKTRKPSQTIESLVSPKTKTWKGRVAKQLRRMHGQTGSPSSPTAQLPPEGATFKVPLEICPPSSFSEYVPLIVEMCTSIVEARGLEVVGIYRVPGNTAAISHLTDSVNKGFENINLQDPRWSDVNVISSLLKSFFRQLPDSLLTAELYPMFIDADKVEDPQRRMTTIRKLLRDLPEHHFETLKYLMFHLKRIVEHSEVNKMEAKNLAIVFGPTLVRASGSRDNMVTMVTDMSHQCRIVESLLNNVDWFFSDDDLDDLSRLSVNLSLPADNSEIDTTSSNNHSLLLNNIQKVEGAREMASAKDIVSSIISAANRKIQRRRKVLDETDNESPQELDKAKGKQETESLSNRRSMALNERQCSVSEIVLMHEHKSQSSRLTDRTSAIETAAMNGSGVDGGDGGNGNGNGGGGGGGGISDCVDRTIDVTNSNGSILSGDRSRKYSQAALESTDRSAVSSASESSRLSSETGLSCFDASSTLSSASNDTKQSSNDEVTIRTYAGLSATTQERIRRFEQETKAMLQRDQNRQRREAEKREEERRRIEMEWQLAKREMENDDLLDSMVDTTVTPSYHLSPSSRISAFNDKSLLDIASRSHARIPPLSIAVQQQPTTVRRVAQLADDELAATNLRTDSATTLKKLKTEKETTVSEASTLPTIRYGSLDSLHETLDASQSPTQQHRKPLSSDVSDDGSDLLTSLTSTFDRKWRSLVSSSNQTIRGYGAEANASSVSDEGDEGDEQEEEEEEEEEADEEVLAKGLTQDSLLSVSLRNLGGASRKKRKERKRTTTGGAAAVQQPRQDLSMVETYRDPSLHKTIPEKHQSVRQKNDAPEKDTDSSVTEKSGVDRLEAMIDVPDNDRSAIVRRKMESKPQNQHRSSKEGSTESAGSESNEIRECSGIEREDAAASVVSSQIGGGDRDVANSPSDNAATDIRRDLDSNYSNKLEKFENLTKFEVRSRLKRSESLNKKSENSCSKLKRSESLNKHSTERLSSPTSGKLKRSESLNKHSAERSDSPNSKLKRSESLTKTEKTECNISKRRQSVRKDSATKLKRKNGMPERSIKRRHTVGGTKDFDKVHWLDNKLQVETERAVRSQEYRPKKSQLRTSSPDLSTGRIGTGLTDASFLIEVSFRGPSNVVFNVTNARPQSLPDTSLPSKVFKVPLESHV